MFWPGSAVIARAGRIVIGACNEFGPGGATVLAETADAAIAIGDDGRYRDGAVIGSGCRLGNGSQVLGPIQRAEKRGEPVLLLGTTLFFMAYFEHMERESLAVTLPRGSRAMDTGGAKGQLTEYQREEVETAFAHHLGIAPSHLVNEYGMAELGSQFYDDNFLAHHEGRARKQGKEIPPWVRTRFLHPETLQEQPDGERGILVHYDLANLDIPLAIQIEDIGSRTGDRLHVEGRLLGAEARGCSLPFEKFLEERGA